MDTRLLNALFRLTKISLFTHLHHAPSPSERSRRTCVHDDQVIIDSITRRNERKREKDQKQVLGSWTTVRCGDGWNTHVGEEEEGKGDDKV